MQDPKIKPRTCVTDGCFFEVADSSKNKCPACLYKELFKKKASKVSSFKKSGFKKEWFNKPKKIGSKTKSIKQIVDGKTKSLQRKAHALWSKIIRLQHGGGQISACCTCPVGKKKPLRTFGNGIWGAHAGHYFEKGKYKWVAYHLMNGGIQCINCNNNHDGEQIEMRFYLTNYHGEDAFKQFESEVREIQYKIDTGQLSSTPPLEWYEDQIVLLTKILNSLNSDI